MNADQRVGLAHRRLAIIDLSAGGAQPMAREPQCIISFNGEIYNFRALRDELTAKGYRFTSNSDTEVLLKLYADRGEEMVKSLRGMFAFALWDGKKKAMLLARDQFGIKPLYYSLDNGVLRAASELKSLLAGGEIDTSPEPAGHAGYFLWGHVPEPYTMYKGAKLLPAGCTLWVSLDKKPTVRRYFDIPSMFREATYAGADLSAEGRLASLRDALLESVRHHLVADVEVGVFLSAGIDSSCLVGLASELGVKLKTITLGFAEFRGTAADETPLAAAVARHYGCEHHTVWITKSDFDSALDRLVDRMDQPSIDGVNSYFVARAAAEVGLKVAMSGLGADELFGGYPSFRQVPSMARIMGRVPMARTIGRLLRVASSPVMTKFSSPKYASLIEYGHSLEGAYMLRRALFLPWELPLVLGPDLVEAGLHDLSTGERLLETTHGIKLTHHKIAALESSWYMRNQLLRDTDWASMSHSLEVRLPFVDWPLWTQVAALGTTTGAPNKHVVASLLSKPLPAEVLSRPKTGFTVPTRIWTNSSGAQENPSHVNRGLRGWAQSVYRAA